MKKGLLVVAAVLVSVAGFCSLSFADNTVPSTMSSTDTNSDGSSMSTTSSDGSSNSTMSASS